MTEMMDATKHNEDCPMLRPDPITKEVGRKTKGWYDNMLSGSQRKHSCPCCDAPLEFEEVNHE